MTQWKCPGCHRFLSDRMLFDWAACECGVKSMNGVALWQTKDLREIPIYEMELSHINNSLALILTKPGWRPGYGKLLIEELERRRKIDDAQT